MYYTNGVRIVFTHTHTYLVRHVGGNGARLGHARAIQPAIDISSLADLLLSPRYRDEQRDARVPSCRRSKTRINNNNTRPYADRVRTGSSHTGARWLFIVGETARWTLRGITRGEHVVDENARSPPPGI